MPRRSPKAVRDGLRPRVIPPPPHIAGLSGYTLACIARAEAALGHLARGRTESAYIRWRDFLREPDRRLWTPGAGCGVPECCGDPFEARQFLGKVHARLPRRARHEFGRRLAYLDARY